MFHMIFFLSSCTAIIIAWWLNIFSMPIVCGLISVELIYSMTFLDFWSLVQGSYSIQILLQIARYRSISENDIISVTEYIGIEKKQSRLQHLITLGLAEKTCSNKMKLSKFGERINSFFRVVKFLAHIKTAG